VCDNDDNVAGDVSAELAKGIFAHLVGSKYRPWIVRQENCLLLPASEANPDPYPVIGKLRAVSARFVVGQCHIMFSLQFDRGHLSGNTY
jgi:hypothetical protein